MTLRRHCSTRSFIDNTMAWMATFLVSKCHRRWNMVVTVMMLEYLRRLRHDGNGHRTRVDTSAPFCLWNSLDSMDATFKLEVKVDVAATDSCRSVPYSALAFTYFT